jgi:predicted XRE-type DNA-binding protein
MQPETQRPTLFIDRSPSRNAAPVLAEHASRRIKIILMTQLREMRRSRGLTQVQTAGWFGVSQPRISHLAQNRTDRFTTDTLINMLAHAGIRVSVIFEVHRNDGESAKGTSARGGRVRWRQNL